MPIFSDAIGSHDVLLLVLSESFDRIYSIFTASLGSQFLMLTPRLLIGSFHLMITSLVFITTIALIFGFWARIASSFKA